MNDVYVESFNNQKFNHDGDGCAVLKITYYYPVDLLTQHLPVKKKLRTSKIL